MAILVTGGAGYIGSHTCVELLDAGYDVVVLDNLSNASEKSLDRVKDLTGKAVKFYKGDILDREILNKIFKEEKIDSCIHFAGLKAVGESVAKPWEYYNNNIAGTLTLVDVMRQNGCKNIIFSSSATVYGDPARRLPTARRGGRRRCALACESGPAHPCVRAVQPVLDLAAAAHGLHVGVAHAPQGAGAVPSGAEKVPGPAPADAGCSGLSGQGQSARRGTGICRSAPETGGPDREMSSARLRTG